MEQNTICLDDILSGKANEMYPDFLDKLLTGSITVILTPEESERVKDIERAIHALDLTNAVDRTDYLGESVIEPLTEAGGVWSWLKRAHTAKDDSLVEKLNEELKTIDDAPKLERFIHECNGFLDEVTTMLSLRHPSDLSMNLKDEQLLDASQRVGFGKKFMRVLKMTMGTFNIAGIPVALLTSSITSTRSVVSYAIGIRNVRDAAQKRLDKIKKK